MKMRTTEMNVGARIHIPHLRYAARGLYEVTLLTDERVEGTRVDRTTDEDSEGTDTFSYVREDVEHLLRAGQATILTEGTSP